MTDECVRDMALQAKAKAMTIFLNHRYNVPEDVFGVTFDSAVTSRAQDDAGAAIWDMDLDINLAGTNPRVGKTYSLIKDDQVKLGVSIGAMIDEYEFKDKEAGFWGGLIIKKVNLLEASIVGIPANQRSWVQNAVLAIKAAAKGIADEEELLMDADDTVEVPPLVVTSTNASLNTTDVAILTTPSLVNATTSTILIHTDAVESDPPAAELETASEEPEAPGNAEGDGSAAAESSDEPSSTEQPIETASATETEQSEPLSGEGASLVEATAAALEAAVGDLRSRDTVIASLNEQVQRLTRERDAAVQVAEAASELIEKIATTPLGRKTVIRESADDFRTTVAKIYGPEIAATISMES